MSITRALLGLLFLTLAASPSAADETLAAPVAQCIRDNAAKVELAVADLNQAVDFLVTDICAEPVAAEQARETRLTSERQNAHWKKLCDDMQDKVAKKPNDVATKGYEAWCSNIKVGFLTEPSGDEGGSGYTLFGAAGRDPMAVALASRLLLDLRLSHVKGRP